MPSARSIFLLFVVSSFVPTRKVSWGGRLEKEIYCHIICECWPWLLKLVRLQSPSLQTLCFSLCIDQVTARASTAMMALTFFHSSNPSSFTRRSPIPTCVQSSPWWFTSCNSPSLHCQLHAWNSQAVVHVERKRSVDLALLLCPFSHSGGRQSSNFQCTWHH